MVLILPTTVKSPPVCKPPEITILSVDDVISTVYVSGCFPSVSFWRFICCNWNGWFKFKFVPSYDNVELDIFNSPLIVVLLFSVTNPELDIKLLPFKSIDCPEPHR